MRCKNIVTLRLISLFIAFSLFLIDHAENTRAYIIDGTTTTTIPQCITDSDCCADFTPGA